MKTATDEFFQRERLTHALTDQFCITTTSFRDPIEREQKLSKNQRNRFIFGHVEMKNMTQKNA